MTPIVDQNGNILNMTFKSIFSFPETVNEVAARFTAGVVCTVALIAIIFNLHFLIFLLIYGFLARVLTGPSLSPVAQVATKVVAKKLTKYAKISPGKPKRFAQSIGLTVTSLVGILYYGVGLTDVGNTLLSVLIVFAAMESILGICVGCLIYRNLIKFHIIKETVCVDCANITKRSASAVSA